MKRLAATVGDPRGIGPEILNAALADREVGERCNLVSVGPSGAGVDVDVSVGEWAPQTDSQKNIELAGQLSGLAIERAVKMVQSGEVDGIVTGPIDKAALLSGGYDFPGHTEMLAHLTGAKVAMMLASSRLRVVLATTHVALRNVADSLTPDTFYQAIDVTVEGLQRWFGISNPRVALCAINPHAGDGGRFGNEDDTLLAPVARERKVYGPFPADTVFVRAMRGEFDAVIAPYHDVGMTAIKVASFGQAVNITLGLPFPRTSPDHGTALDIAGRGIADPSSFIAAVLQCATMAELSQNPSRQVK